MPTSLARLRHKAEIQSRMRFRREAERKGPQKRAPFFSRFSLLHFPSRIFRRLRAPFLPSLRSQTYASRAKLASEVRVTQPPPSSGSSSNSSSNSSSSSSFLQEEATIFSLGRSNLFSSSPPDDIYTGCFVQLSTVCRPTEYTVSSN